MAKGRPHSHIFFIPLFSLVFITANQASADATSINDTFSRLKNHTLEFSPDLQAAQALASQKRAALYTSWTRWFPRADLRLSQTQTRDYSLLTSNTVLGSMFAGLTPSQTTLYSWNLALSMPLYRRSVHVGIQAAIFESEQTDWQHALRRTELDWRLRQLLGTYLLQLYKIATLKTSTELARTNLREAKVRFELGERTRVDVIRAEANLLSLESKNLTFEQDRNAALSALLEYTGTTRKELSDLLPEESLASEDPLLLAINSFTETENAFHQLNTFLPQDPSTPPDQQILHSRITESSPAYRSMIADEASSHARARQWVASEWPEVLLQGSLNKQAESWNRAFEPDSRSHSIAVIINIPLFSFGSTFSGFSEQLNAQKVAEVKRTKDSLQLRDEVENQAMQLQAMRKMLLSQKLSLDRNEELARLSQKSYQLGKTTLLELLTSQNELVEAKLALAQTKLNAAVLSRKFAWNLGVPLE